jgi:hypothetical protein
LLDKNTSGSQTNQLEVASKQKVRILDFWRFVHGTLKAKSVFTEDEQKVASELTRLSCYLDALDTEALEWLTFLAKHVDKNFNSSFFIEYLLRLCDVSPSQIGVVYIEMLNGATPIYDQKNIRSIVTKLYERGEANAANRICNIYGGRGLEFLRDVYEHYNYQER